MPVCLSNEYLWTWNAKFQQIANRVISSALADPTMRGRTVQGLGKSNTKCVPVNKCLHQATPTYVTELYSPVSGSANNIVVRSAARRDLAVTRSRTTRYGQSCFAVSSPLTLWNSLPLSVLWPITPFCVLWKPVFVAASAAATGLP